MKESNEFIRLELCHLIELSDGVVLVELENLHTLHITYHIETLTDSSSFLLFNLHHTDRQSVISVILFKC